MSLLNDLRDVASKLDSQYQPVTNEIQGLLAALIHYAEHGNPLLEAAAIGAEEVAKLIDPEPEPEQAASGDVQAQLAALQAQLDAQTAPVTPPAPATADELAAQISDLQAQLAARQATSQATTVDHEPGSDPTPAGGVSLVQPIFGGQS